MSHDTTILMELFVIFIWAKIFGEIFEHWKLPAALGEISCGILLGPHAIALIKPTEFTFSIAQVGAVFLLLNVGLETRPQELIRVGTKSLGVALGGVLLPFAAGFGYMLLARYSAHEATFVAAAMVATSVAVTARVLRDMGVLRTDAARIILGAAVFDDILGMLVLAFVMGLASSSTIRWLQLTILAAEAVAFAFFMIFVAPRLIERIRTRIQDFSIPNAPIFLAMGLGLGLAAVAEKIGLAAIIGAFFAGLAFAEYGDEWKIRPHVAGVSDFLAPFFFFVIGTQLNLKVFSSPSLAITAVVISLLAILSKLVGCGLPLAGQGLKLALQVGLGMVPRAEVGLIVAALGLQAGLLSQSSYAVVVLMAMVTTLATPPLLRLTFRSNAAQGGAVQKLPRPKDWRRIIGPLLGIGFSGAVAGLATVLFREHPSRVLVPTGFLIVIILIAWVWGRVAGVLATATSALVFAFVLFNPVGSWKVNDDAARTNLGWMILGGTALSYFLGKQRRGHLQESIEHNAQPGESVVQTHDRPS
jgi:Kef-type K+ transport system membrane component KefB